MAIVRWDPFDAFLGAQEDLNRMFRRGWLRGPATCRRGGLAPAVDIYETEDSLVVEAELPGVDPKDIDMTVDEGVLTLKGERKLEKGGKGGELPPGRARLRLVPALDKASPPTWTPRR